MTRHLPLWKRITCSLLLAMFALSALGGTICTGHKAAHAAVETAWSDAALSAATGHAVAGHVHDQGHHHPGDAGGHGSSSTGDAGCDAPVYLTTSGIAASAEKPWPPTAQELPALLDTVLAHAPAAAAARRAPPVAPDRQPPPLQDPFSVTARLRL